MSLSVEWRPVGKTDRNALAHFICTDPEKASSIRTPERGWHLSHPREWEHDAQLLIRALARSVPPPTDETILVGIADGELAAVSHWVRLEGPGLVHLEVLGVAQRFRQPEVRLGREAMTETLRLIERDAIEIGAAEMNVQGEVFRDNEASLNMVRQFHFEFFDEADSGAQTWSLKFPIAPTES